MSRSLRAQPVKRVATVDGLLLPVVGSPLFVPMAAIAEIIPARGINLSAHPGNPAWLYGWFSWRDQHIPLISYEAAVGAVAAVIEESSRIAICNAVASAAERGFYALVIQGLPRPVRLSEEDAFSIVPEENPGVGVLSQVSLEEERARVPDLDYLEQISMTAIPALSGSLPEA